MQAQALPRLKILRALFRTLQKEIITELTTDCDLARKRPHPLPHSLPLVDR